MSGDVVAHGGALRGSYGEAAVAFLPFKGAVADFIVDPAGGDAFDFAHHIGDAMGGAEADEEVDVISHAADGFGDAAEPFYDAAEEGVQAFAPCGEDVGCAAFCGKDEVVVK